MREKRFFLYRKERTYTSGMKDVVFSSAFPIYGMLFELSSSEIEAEKERGVTHQLIFGSPVDLSQGDTIKDDEGNYWQIMSYEKVNNLPTRPFFSCKLKKDDEAKRRIG